MIDILSLLRPKKTQKKTAGQIAKERLKLVLIHDRSDCSGELLESIRKDIMEVLSKYMEIDMEALDIQISTTRLDENDDQEVPALYANIPIKNIKHLPEKEPIKVDKKKKETKVEDKKTEDKKVDEKKNDEKTKETKEEIKKDKDDKKEDVKEEKVEETKEEKISKEEK